MDQELEKVLALKEGKHPDIIARNAVREAIKKVLPQLSCCVLPHPGVTKKLEDIPDSVLSPKFTAVSL